MHYEHLRGIRKLRSRNYRLIPSLMTIAATAIPFITAADILNRAQVTASGPATTTQVTAAPPTAVPAGTTPAGASVTTPPGPQATSVAGTTSGATVPAGTAPQTYAGTVEWNRYGSVEATIIVSGSKITGVNIAAPGDNPRSAYINGVAVPILQSQTLQAQSANIDGVSGATYTSESYVQSLQSAIDQAHL